MEGINDGICVICNRGIVRFEMTENMSEDYQKYQQALYRVKLIVPFL